MTLFAAPVSQQQAKQIAAQFLSGKSSSHRSMSASEMKATVVLDRLNSSGAPCLYAVQVASGSGYVIVSGDDRTPAVLGYQTNGSYDESVMPENMRSWLQHYADEIELLQRYNLTTPRRAMANAGDPIAKTTTCTWDQSNPYDRDCPMVTSYLDEGLTTVYKEADHALTGCVATAMAQVLYVWKDEYAKPETKEGKVVKDIPAQENIVTQYSVRDNEATIPIWVNYSDAVIPAGSPIDWGNLIDAYTKKDDKGKPVVDEHNKIVIYGTPEQQAAVARLMHICAAAVHTSYGPGYASGSFADMRDILAGFYSYLGFTSARLKMQNGYDDAWVQALYDELAAAKGVLLSGVSSVGGHTFVVDGYDKEDLFHINWGWASMGNEAMDNGGFYRLNSLLPTDSRVGGSGRLVPDGFNAQQMFLTGIYPNAPAPQGDDTSVYVGMMATPQTSVTLKDGELRLRLYATATVAFPVVDAQLGFCLEDKTGNKIFRAINEGLSPIIFQKIESFDGVLSWSGIGDGSYKVRMFYRTELTDEAWTPCKSDENPYIRIEVSNGQATIHNSGTSEVDLVSHNLKEEYVNTTNIGFSVNYKVTEGALEMEPQVSASPVLRDGAGEFVTDKSRNTLNSTIAPTSIKGEKGTEFTVQGNFSASDLQQGYYQVLIMDDDRMLPGEFYFLVTEDPTGIKTLTPFRSDGNGAYYDLQGRKLQGIPTAKGMYIKNGTKVVVPNRN